MSKLQKKMAKKKAKEKEDRKKLLVRRDALRKKAKEEREEHRRDKRIKRLQRELDAFEHRSKEELEAMPEETLSQLEKNARILRVLEEEHEQERLKKQELNESLEAEGHVTLEDKLKTLQERTVLQQKENFGVGDSATCNFNIAPPTPKETASVEILRAPDADEEEKFLIR